jgi:SAM-dependent methyltransferase
MKWNENLGHQRLNAIPDRLFCGRVLEIGGRYPERVLTSRHRDAVLRANIERRWLSIDLLPPQGDAPLEFRQQDLFDIEPDALWDAILACEFIEHIELRRWPQMFETFKGLLRPGGRLFISCPYREPVLAIKNYLSKYHPHDPANIHVVFDIDEDLIRQFLPDAEFRILRIRQKFREKGESLVWAIGREIGRVLRRHRYALRWLRRPRWLTMVWRKEDEMKRCKSCGTVIKNAGIWTHCPECGYPYNLPCDERPECWYEEAES